MQTKSRARSVKPGSLSGTRLSAGVVRLLRELSMPFAKLTAKCAACCMPLNGVNIP
jgi:hypothetical protein